MADEQDIYTTAQYREHLDGYGTRDPAEHGHTGIVRDPKVSRYLSILAENHDPKAWTDPDQAPGEARRLSEVEQITAIAATETGRQALDNGDIPSLKHLAGDQNQRHDVSGLKAIGKIDDLIKSPAPVIVVLGEMGSGKSNFGGLLGQRATQLLGIETVASNIRSLREVTTWTDQRGEERDGYVPTFPKLKEWVRQDGDPLKTTQRPKLFIGDEFSSKGSGSGKHGYETRQKMAPLVFKIRKHNGMLVYIGHDESSIHPLLWRVGVVVKKTGKKKAIVADRIKNGELRDIRFEVEGIPRTDWRYNDKEPSWWSWTDSEEPGEADEPDADQVARDCAIWTVRECKQQDLSDRETAKFVPYSKSWVNDKWREIQAGDHKEALDTVEALTT